MHTLLQESLHADYVITGISLRDYFLHVRQLSENTGIWANPVTYMRSKNERALAHFVKIAPKKLVTDEINHQRLFLRVSEDRMVCLDAVTTGLYRKYGPRFR